MVASQLWCMSLYTHLYLMTALLAAGNRPPRPLFKGQACSTDVVPQVFTRKHVIVTFETCLSLPLTQASSNPIRYPSGLLRAKIHYT